MDMAGQGDIKNCGIQSIEHAQGMVIENGWSSVTVAKNGHAYFKKFNYQLAEHHLKPNPHVDAIWIYNPNGHATVPYKWWAPKG